ncbi:LON peptidase substrate-binding domain-containing protein [soil metagenome]|nr:LON peptidase substrate-binding domain-containing protein [Gemmatimonadota bacterium]
MRRLPLFPLPVVLFPGAMMPLHLFEPRYRQMAAHCVEGDKRFGLLYHDPDHHGPFRMEQGRVGCIAEILKFQPLPDGRSLILAGGIERFVLDDGIESEALYYEGLVHEQPDTPDSQPGLLERRRRSIRLFHQVAEKVMEQPESAPQIDERLETAYQIAQAVRVDPTWQQELLEAPDERDRLEQVDTLLRTVLENEE